jgi:hypothetical protein
MCILKDFSPCIKRCSLWPIIFYLLILPFLLWVANELSLSWLAFGVNIYITVFDTVKFGLQSWYKSLNGSVQPTTSCTTGLMHQYYYQSAIDVPVTNNTACQDYYKARGVAKA